MTDIYKKILAADVVVLASSMDCLSLWNYCVCPYTHGYYNVGGREGLKLK